MRIFLSIFLSVFVLLAGMNFSVATHICHDKVAAAKASFSGAHASCGMETEDPSGEAQLKTHCCDDQISSFNVDDDYSPSSFQVKNFIQDIIQVFVIPVALISDLSNLLNIFSANAGPPGIYSVSSVELTGICVFRL